MDSNVQLHHDRICVNLCVQSNIHVTPLSFVGENFRTFLTAQHVFHHFFLLLYIASGKWDNLFLPFFLRIKCILKRNFCRY